MNPITKSANPGLLQASPGLPQSPLSSSEDGTSPSRTSPPNLPGNWNIHEPPQQRPPDLLPIQIPALSATRFCLLWSTPSPDHQKISNWQIQHHPTSPFLSIWLRGPHSLETYPLDFHTTTFSSSSGLLHSLFVLGTPPPSPQRWGCMPTASPTPTNSSVTW